MTRSLKKGPYIDFRLRKKIDLMNESGSKKVIKTSLKEIRMIIQSFTVVDKTGKNILLPFIMEKNLFLYL